MKPRIFISSTFYDLKYIREDLANFVRAHDYEPVMFEEGDIGYTPGRHLDESCYDSMRSSDMVILIIGGNYGSPATGEKEDSFEEYLSITRKEFDTAVKSGIPVYVFVDSAVYSEFGVYEVNFRLIEERKNQINFRATKNINVFRFIREIKSIGNIPITEFRRPNEIKDFLSKQWADMFKNYLRMLREEKDTDQLHDAMNNINSLIEQMGVMVNGLGKKLINNDQNINYDNLLKQQYHIKARDIARKITKIVQCDFCDYNNKESNAENLVDIFCELILRVSERKSGNKKANAMDDEETIDEIISSFCVNLGKHGIYPHKLRINSIFEDESFIEMCLHEEIKQEVKKILSNDFYYSKFSDDIRESDFDEN